MKKIMLLSTILASAFAITTFAGAARAQAIIAPEWVKVVDISGFGSGCPAGTVSGILSPDKLSLTLKFSQFDAQIDPTVTPPINNPNENCAISVLLDFPGGYSYAISTVDYLGRADLGQRTIGQQTSRYWFQGQFIRSKAFQTTLHGGIEGLFGDYDRRDTLGLADMVWHPCGAKRNLNIDANVSVSNTANPKAKAYMNLKVVEFTVQQTYGLNWRLCR